MSEPTSQDEVWRFDDHPGYRRAIETAGAVAAPLLAGFAFTLLVLILPTLEEHKEVMLSGRHTRVVGESAAFSGLPELAAGCLLLAGISLVFSVQAAINLRYHNHRPSDLAEWYPEYFPDNSSRSLELAEGLGEWNTREWPAIRLGDRWYGGWPRRYLHEEIRKANKSAKWMRWAYHLGILSLLVGLTTLVWPPAAHEDPGRWALVGIGAVGVIVEAIWICRPLAVLKWRQRRDR